MPQVEEVWLFHQSGTHSPLCLMASCMASGARSSPPGQVTAPHSTRTWANRAGSRNAANTPARGPVTRRERQPHPPYRRETYINDPPLFIAEGSQACGVYACLALKSGRRAFLRRVPAAPTPERCCAPPSAPVAPAGGREAAVGCASAHRRDASGTALRLTHPTRF